jgi:hypothetical protein
MKENYNDELSLEELDKITAGYPVNLNGQILPDLSQYDEEEKTKEVQKEEIPVIFITENERYVNNLPYGELSEEELDNVIAGRLG